MVHLYYSALLVVVAFLFVTLILLPFLTSVIIHIAYFLISLFRNLQNRNYYW